MIQMDTDFSAKQESSSNNADYAKTTTTTTTTTSWSKLKDPRIVRVSRALGGKDRHSKVCTIRGLRDRRVRLSVPTAIQLYDLQERLGLNQPSKVVDWLLHAAKHEIQELPPLQIPQGFMLDSQYHSHHNKQDGKSCKDDESWTRHEEEEYNLETNQGNAYVSSSSSMSRQQNPSSFSSLLSSSSNNNLWDPSSLSLSSQQHEDFSVVYQPYFTHQIAPTNAAFDHPTARPAFNFNMAVDRHPSHNNAGNEQSKRQHLPSS